MQAAVYVRVSTDEQSASGLGIDAQIDSCRRWASRHRATFVGPFTDDEGVCGGASLEKRPALLEAIATLRKGDILLVAKRDRLGRGDPFLLGMIEAAVKRRGARVMSAAGEGTDGDSPTDVLMRRVCDAFGEYERLVIASRTSAALQAKIRRGQRVGNVRYGFDLGADGKTLVPNAVEQAILALIYELRDGGRGAKDIAAELNRRSFRAKKGGPWIHTAVARLLARRGEARSTAVAGD